MATIKVPSWFELLALRQFASEKDAHSFWKEQALRFGFDIRQARSQVHNNLESDARWQSFFFEQFFQYSLKRAGGAQNFKASEKAFWKQHGKHVEKLELSNCSIQDLEFFSSWFPNVKWLSLHRCHSLLQTSSKEQLSRPMCDLKKLQMLEIVDAHLLSANAFALIPAQIKQLKIERSKGITVEFFDELAKLSSLAELSIHNSPEVCVSCLSRLPQSLKVLDLSGSGKGFDNRGIDNKVLHFMPQSLSELKLNDWDHLGDQELDYLPPTLSALEIAGWNITAQGLEKLERFSLESINLSRTGMDHEGRGLIFLPRTLKRLNLSQNGLSSEALNWLNVLESLEELEYSHGAPFGAKLDDAPIVFSPHLERLDLSYSGPFHSQTVQTFRQLKKLKSLSLAGCGIENSDLDFLPVELEELDLSLCSGVTDVGLTMLKGLKKLVSLNMEGCEEIRGFGIASLSPELKKISFRGCNRLSGKCLDHLPAVLEELYLDSCDLVTSEDLQNLPLSLQCLSLANCSHITNDVLDYLSCLPLLTNVTLTGCSKIADVEILKHVRRRFEGTIISTNDIELHPPVSMLKKLTNFKARLINKLKSLSLR